MSHAELLEAFDRSARPRVLVLGDLILDRYTWGNAERVSQEAPVILLRADRREARLGGAANVCNMLKGLEAQVVCAGVVGADRDGRLVRQMLTDAGIGTGPLLADPDRPTTVKERFIGRAANRHPHQILRVDSEVREPLGARLEAELAAWLVEHVRDVDVVLVSDYDKGVCTPTLLGLVIEAARRSQVPVIVDPLRGRDYQRYHGATTMTPNRTEAELATGVKIATSDDAFRAGAHLCRQLALEMAIVTLDRDGMALVPSRGEPRLFPTRARAVYDITGAGDMVLAAIGVFLASGLPPAVAVQLANVAAGLEVERVGVAVIPRSEIRAELLAGSEKLPNKVVSLEHAAQLAQDHRRQGRRVVFTNGCFDLLHVGHARYLEEAAALGDVLFVGVNSDESVRRLKGSTRPVIDEASRAAMLAALAAVDHVVVFEDDTPHRLLEAIRPDVLVKGGTYTPDEVVGHEVVEAYGGTVTVTSLTPDVSTSRIIERLGEGRPPAPPTPASRREQAA